MDVIVRRWITYMKTNNLGFKVICNGEELSEEKINLYLVKESE